jgi:hypothetical protein
MSCPSYPPWLQLMYPLVSEWDFAYSLSNGNLTSTSNYVLCITPPACPWREVWTALRETTSLRLRDSHTGLTEHALIPRLLPRNTKDPYALASSYRPISLEEKYGKS